MSSKANQRKQKKQARQQALANANQPSQAVQPAAEPVVGDLDVASPDTAPAPFKAAVTCQPPPSFAQPSSGSGTPQKSASSTSMAPQPAQLPIAATSASSTPQQQQVALVGAPRVRVQNQQPSDRVLRVSTNYFSINPLPGNHKLHEYQLTKLVGHTPDLGRSKKKVMIDRFVSLSAILPSDRHSFVVNGEGRIIAWQDLSPGAQAGIALEQHRVPDYDRAQVNAAARHIPMDLVYVRTINLNDLFNYAAGTNQNYPVTIAEGALNILFGRAVQESGNGVWQVGDNQFFTSAASTPLGPAGRQAGSWGLDAIRGYSSHVKARDGSVLLNVNTALSAFYRGKVTVHDTIKSICGNHFPSAFLNSPKAQNHLIGVRVRILHNRDKPDETSRKDTAQGRLKTITGFSRKPADEVWFTNSNGVQTSVWQHFHDSYPEQAQRLRCGKMQFCVNTGDLGRPSWFLAELLEIVEGQIYRRTLDGVGTDLTANMITIACRRPHVNQQDIVSNGLPALGFLHGHLDPPRLRNAGLVFTRTMLDVPIRQIPQPNVQYAGNRTVTFRNPGKWSTRGMKFLTSTNRINGRVALFCPGGGLLHPGLANAYINGLRGAWTMNLINQNAPAIANAFQQLPNMDIAGMRQPLSAAGIGLLVLCLPHKNSTVRPRYANFRAVADQILGRPSLVICEDRILGSLGADQNNITGGRLIPYFANNMAKVNTRFGNQNHTVAGAFASLSPNSQCDTLVLGADLIHPKGNSSEVTPTVASVVGSIDGNFATFLGSSRRMPAATDLGREYIDSQQMVSMVTERISAWRAKNGRLPKRILYYRDGTGETQYGLIQREVLDIRTAYGNLTGSQEQGNRLPVTAVVAVKRHTTRFYPATTAPPTERTKTGNCVPGTVVDSQITSRYYFDFFLQSHDVEQGSAKPTHYFVLENGMGFSEHALQDLTNAFCYNFSHSTSAISYASPAYYADRLCERVMLYLDSHYSHWTTVQNLGSTVARQSDLDNAWSRHGQLQNPNPWHSNFNNLMFWM